MEPIQSKVNNAGNGSSVTTTLDAAPTEGSLLVGIHSINGTDSVPPDGTWTLDVGAGSSPGTFIYSKVVGASESADYTFTSDSNKVHSLSLVELPEGAEFDTGSSAAQASDTSISTGTTPETYTDQGTLGLDDADLDLNSA